MTTPITIAATMPAGRPNRPPPRIPITKPKQVNVYPVVAQQLADETARLGEQLAKVKAELVDERAAGSVLRRLVAELSLELDQARHELTAASAVARLPVRGGAS